MANDLLAQRIERMIEDLMAHPDKDGPAVASLLMAAQIALRLGVPTHLALAAWDFVDAQRPPEVPARSASRG